MLKIALKIAINQLIHLSLNSNKRNKKIKSEKNAVLNHFERSYNVNNPWKCDIFEMLCYRSIWGRATKNH